MASSTKAIAAFFVWTVTSFLCHKLAQLAVQCFNDIVTSENRVVGPLIVTVCQTLTCYSTVTVSKDRGSLYAIIALSHFLATLATNTSFTFIFASSTMAFKLLEPVTSTFIQNLVLKTSMPPRSVLSMLGIVLGAVLFVGNPLASTLVVQGTVMALLSNIILAVRNTGIKLSQTAGKKMGLRSPHQLVLYSVCVILLLLVMSVLEHHVHVLPEDTTYSTLLAFSSSLFHVIYSYVSTNVVLCYMSVVSHAIANVIKRVLVVLLLHVSGRRHVTLANWVGLVLCTCSLLLYNARKITSSPSTSSSPDKTSVYSASSDSSEDGEKEFSGAHQAAKDSLDKKLVLLRSILLLCVLPYVLCLLVLGDSISKPNYAQQLRHGIVNWRDGQPLLKDEIVYQPVQMNETYVNQFMQEQLVNIPWGTDGLAPYLSTSKELLAETERVHLNLLSSLIGRKKFVILVGLASFENKGDPAITMGQLKLIEKLNLTLIHYIDEETCKDEDFITALKHSIFLTPDDLVLFAQGGGNIIGYEGANRCRKKGMEYFPDYQMIILSQSILMSGHKSYVEQMVNLYCCKPNLTIFLRDRLSYYMATRMFGPSASSAQFSGGHAVPSTELSGEHHEATLVNNSTRLVLAPDMALENEPVARFTSPFYDVLWLKRLDKERPIYDVTPRFPANVSVKIADWWIGWDTAHGSTTAETANNVYLNGLIFLQRGRVVITERLHGHIMSVLLDIPHVILDNKDNKLSSYHNTWTRGLKNVRMTNDPKVAVELALELLQEYDKVLPKTVKAGRVKEYEN